LSETAIRDNKLSPHFALLGVQVLFGTLPVIAKVVLKTVPPVALVGMRVAIAAVFLYAVQRSRGSLRLEDRRDYLRLFVWGSLAVVLNQLLFVGGLSQTKASNASLLVVTIPIFAITISAIIGTEKLTAAKAAGIALAAAGVIFLIDPRNASFSSENTRGDLMIIANSLSYGIYVAGSKDTITRNGALKSTAWMFIFSCVVCLPLGAWSLSSIDASAVEPYVWLLVLHIAILATATPYLLNAWALSRVNPSVVAVYIYLQPLIGFVMALVFLGEKLELKAIVAAMLIFAGLFLVTKKFRAQAIVSDK
jgi:drug/metabolite transporter (DMT)-like permease